MRLEMLTFFRTKELMSLGAGKENVSIPNRIFCISVNHLALV